MLRRVMRLMCPICEKQAARSPENLSIPEITPCACRIEPTLLHCRCCSSESAGALSAYHGDPTGALLQRAASPVAFAASGSGAAGRTHCTQAPLKEIDANVDVVGAAAAAKVRVGVDLSRDVAAPHVALRGVRGTAERCMAA